MEVTFKKELHKCTAENLAVGFSDLLFHLLMLFRTFSVFILTLTDLPKSVVSDNYDDADAAANAPANGLASGWLNKLPISDTKSLAKPKKRSVFKKCDLDLCHFRCHFLGTVCPCKVKRMLHVASIVFFVIDIGLLRCMIIFRY